MSNYTNKQTSQSYYSYSSGGSYSSDYADNSEEIDYTGKILQKKYIILWKLGSGAFASVWLSYNYNDKNFYAIKIQNEDDYNSAMREIDCFQEIATKVKNIKDHNLLLLKEWFMYNKKNVCMVTDLMAGSIYTVLKNKKIFSFENTFNIIRQIANATNILHEMKIIHTDIKPENILIEGKNTLINKITTKFQESDFCKKLKKYSHNYLIKNAHKELDAIFYDIDLDEIKYEIFDEYIQKDTKIRLADFGTCNKINRINFEIQTRYYRAPEIILKYDYNEKCDIWSIGCTLFEMLTGNILFDPGKTSSINRDRHHLYWFQQLLGKIPDELINKSKKRNSFFTQQGALKGVKRVDYFPLNLVLTEKYNIDNNKINKIIIILLPMLEYKTKNRLSAKMVINYIDNYIINSPQNPKSDS